MLRGMILTAIALSASLVSFAEETKTDDVVRRIPYSQRGMMGGAMGSMMGSGGMGLCQLMTQDTRVELKNIKNGVVITLTTDKPGQVARLQKMAEVMRLMQEIGE